ncbi:aryl-sulfate sulfotransferase [Maridesulfovibrio sp. FT414]|uniref:aryl-sulfate sulfotransferase n=1 Tax=Maridesulfovibrio sp. FT414 TaxID=2979469 RepID=UPI003D80268C
MRFPEIIITVILSIAATVTSTYARDSFPVVINKQDKVFSGTVLLSDISNPDRPTISEISRDGTVIWEYQLPRAMRGAIGELNLLKNGNILFTVFGKGIYEITRDKKIVWEHLEKGASHDAQRLPNGNTIYNRGWVEHGGIHVREIDPSHNTVWEWTGLADFDREPYLSVYNEGWMHVNAVTRLKNGNTLLSLRNFNTIAEVNPAGKVVHSCTFRHKGPKGLNTDGPLPGAANHAPEFQKQGTLLFATRRPDAIYEIDWKTCTPVHRWTHPDGKGAIRTIRDCNRLPNGNTLIVGSVKIIEVNNTGEVVWQVNAPKSKRNDRLFHRAIVIGNDGLAYGD